MKLGPKHSPRNECSDTICHTPNFDHPERDYNSIFAPFLGPSTYVANRKETKITKRSQLQSSVTGYLTTRFSIIGLIKQPFQQAGLIHTNTHQIMLA